MIEFRINCMEWGFVNFIGPTRRGDDPWGDLAPLRGTYFEEYVSILESEIIENAIMGHVMPLISSLKPENNLISAKINKKLGKETLCKNYTSCGIRSKHCNLNKKSPICYESKILNFELSYPVLNAIRDGTKIVVILGESEENLITGGKKRIRIG